MKILLGILISFFLSFGSVSAEVDFVGDFEYGTIFDLRPIEGWTGLQVLGIESVELVNSPACNQRSLKLTIQENQGLVNEGVRAEIVYDNRDLPESDKWYAWAFMVPDGYAHSDPGLWQIMGQFHDQPPPGVSWDDWGGKGHSPPIALHYISQLTQDMSAELHALIPNLSSYVENGIFSAAFVTVGLGPANETIGLVPIIQGAWNEIVFHIKWSMGSGGLVEFYKDRKFIGQKSGPNMWNDQPHYLKLGLYRSPAITHQSSVYIDELRVGDSAWEVIVPFPAGCN